jgi:abortive infection bacteriophage resistance protein
MRYSKPPVSLDNQVARLKQRGLMFDDEPSALIYLSNISYYRLRAYTYPFQDNSDCDHPFIASVTFEEIIDLYKFDRRLNQIVFGALEKIEIALRTQIIYQWAMVHGSHWQIDPSLYRDPVRFAGQIASLQTEINRSNETFIDHYRSKYSIPSEPPAWMSLEVTSFGLLSQIFQNLKKGPEKIAVAKHFGLNDISLLENWMHCFSNIRNICAHHSRLWNRRLTTHIKLPYKPTFTFISNLKIHPYKVYASFCCMQYILNIVNSGNGFKSELKELMNECPLAQEKEMGFPPKWEDDEFWRD